jgi:hypothetical protein
MPTLQRYYSHYKHRATSYYNPCSVALWSEVSKGHKLDPQATITDVLQACDTPILFMLPDREGKYPSESDLYSVQGLQVKKYLSKRKSATVDYKGKRTHMYPISTWFDLTPGQYLEAAIKGHRLLQELLEKSFQPKKAYTGDTDYFPVELLATPGQMGSDLLKRSLPYNQEYEPLSDEIANLLLEHTTQGRIETFYHGIDQITDLNYSDGRWMYAACTRHTPTGRVQHDTINEYMLYVPGLYRVQARVPHDWQHIGLLPLKATDHYVYPREPKQEFTSWATSHEIALALKSSWTLTIQERILWPDTDRNPEPLKTWTEKLVRLRMEVADTYPEPYRSMLKAAIRNIMLHTIGTFFRHAKETDGYTSDPDFIPEESTSEILLEGGIWKYTLLDRLSPLQRALSQPQWSMDIWGKARAKLAQNALQVPFQELIALRVDGIWTNCAMTYPDNGKPGQFIRKPLKENTGLVWPKNTRQMVQLVQRVKA